MTNHTQGAFLDGTFEIEQTSREGVFLVVVWPEGASPQSKAHRRPEVMQRIEQLDAEGYTPYGTMARALHAQFKQRQLF